MDRNPKFITACKVWVCVFIPVGLLEILLSMIDGSPQDILSGIFCTLVNLALLTTLVSKGHFRRTSK